MIEAANQVENFHLVRSFIKTAYQADIHEQAPQAQTGVGLPTRLCWYLTVEVTMKYFGCSKVLDSSTGFGLGLSVEEIAKRHNLNPQAVELTAQRIAEALWAISPADIKNRFNLDKLPDWQRPDHKLYLVTIDNKITLP